MSSRFEFQLEFVSLIGVCMMYAVCMIYACQSLVMYTLLFVVVGYSIPLLSTGSKQHEVLLFGGI